MAQALGVRLLDAAGANLGWGGGELARLEHIDFTGRDPRLNKMRIDVACNWHNVLCGPRGVARIFGPQKGASPEVVKQLADALEHFAAVIYRETGKDVREIPGGGASGGLGTGLQVFLGARLHPRYDVVMQYLKIDRLLRETDLVITAEGSIDFQTALDKIPAMVARRAKEYGLPVIALAGTIGQGACQNFAIGIDSFSGILETPCSLEDAINNAPNLISNAAERVMRLIQVGRKLDPNR
jgi:glycerate kinase